MLKGENLSNERRVPIKFLQESGLLINREVGEQKKLMLEGKEFICFYLTMFTPRDSKRHETQQCFAAQNSSKQKIMSVSHLYKMKIYLSRRKPFLQRFISKQKEFKFYRGVHQVQICTSLKMFGFV